MTATRLRTGAARARLTEHVASLVEPARTEGRTPLEPGQVGLRVDQHGRPTAVLIPRRRADDDRSTHRVAPVSLLVPASAGVVEVARRLVARPEDCRFDPVVCIDERGRAVGVLRLERILLRLAELKVGR